MTKEEQIVKLVAAYSAGIEAILGAPTSEKEQERLRALQEENEKLQEKLEAVQREQRGVYLLCITNSETGEFWYRRCKEGECITLRKDETAVTVPAWKNE